MNDTDIETFEDPKYTLHRVKFCLFLALQIPSVLLSLLIFIFFSTHRTLLHVRQNQGLLLLLVVNFIQVSFDIPMVIHFNHLGRVSPATSAYCTWWTFLEYTLLVESVTLMAVISIQRHVFIFQKNIFNIGLYRYLFHHLPLIFFLIYPIILYLVIIIFYPCDGTQWDFNSNICGLANCYLVYNKPLATFDWTANNGLPMIIVILANVTLVIRVIRQKLRRQGVVTWKKQRRMTLQLLSISFLYFIGWFPNLVIGLIQQLILPTFIIEVQMDYIFDLVYLICLLLPWVCLGLFPEFINWIRKYLFCQHRRNNIVGLTTTLI